MEAEFYSIVPPPNHTLPTDWEQNFEDWIGRCRDMRNSPLDINQLARYCVYCNKLPVVEYLVSKEEADLTQQDNRGRSAIFYTMSHSNIKPTEYIPMLKYIVSSCPDMTAAKNILDQTDKRGQHTPLHYAVKWGNLLGIEFLLAMGASTTIENKSKVRASGLIGEPNHEKDPRTQSEWQMRLLFEFNRSLPAWSNLAFGGGTLRDSGIFEYQSYALYTETVSTLQNDLRFIQDIPGREFRNLWLEHDPSIYILREKLTGDDGKRDPTWLHVSSVNV